MVQTLRQNAKLALVVLAIVTSVVVNYSGFGKAYASTMPYSLGPDTTTPAFNALDMDPIIVRDGANLWFEYTAGGLGTQPIYRFKGTTMDNLVRQPDGVKDSSFTQQYGDDKYWIASAWRDPSSGIWYATVHVEFHYSVWGTHFRRIGLATSSDQGAHWHYLGNIITSDASYDMTAYSGNYFNDGQGDQKLYVDASGGYFYLYYRDDWMNKTNFNDRTSTVAAARCPISAKMAPGCWHKFYNGSWSQPALGGHDSPLFHDADSATVFFDSYTGTFMAIGAHATGPGDFISENTNLTTQDWSTPQVFSDDDTTRTKWYNWPVNPTTWDRMTVGQTFRLYSSDVDTSGPTKYMNLTFCATQCAAPTAGNVVQDGSFDGSSLSPWSVVLHAGASATVTQETSTYRSAPDSAKVTITQANAVPWYGQLKQDNIPLVAGQRYTVSFAAKASQNRNLNVVVQQDHPTWNEYANRDFALTQSWQPYSFSFTPGVNDSTSMLNFDVAQATGQLWIDDVSITPSGPKPIPNLLENGSFTTGSLQPWNLETHSGASGSAREDTSTFISSPGSENITVTQSNSVPWYVQLTQGNIPVSQNLQYAITFWAKASLNRNINVVVQKNYAPWTEFANRNLTITTTWQKYSLIFTPSSTEPNAVLSFNLAESTGQVWLDDISMPSGSAA